MEDKRPNGPKMCIVCALLVTESDNLSSLNNFFLLQFPKHWKLKDQTERKNLEPIKVMQCHSSSWGCYSNRNLIVFGASNQFSLCSFVQFLFTICCFSLNLFQPVHSGARPVGGGEHSWEEQRRAAPVREWQCAAAVVAAHSSQPSPLVPVNLANY